MATQVRILSRIILLFIPFILLNFIYINSQTWKTKYGMEKYNDIPQNIEIANLGSSHGFHSFNYSIEGFKDNSCFNFAIGQQTLDFDCGLLKQYVSHFKEKSTLIICVSPFETDGIPDYTANKDAQFRYYGFLKRNNFASFSERDWFLFNYFALFTSKHPARDIRDSLAELLVDGKKKQSNILTSLQQEVPLSPEKSYADVSYEEKLMQAEEILDVWTYLFPPKPNGRDFNIGYLDEMISICSKNNINTIVVTTPISREVFDALKNRSTYYDIDKFHKELASRHPETKFLNYIDLFFGKDRLFRDNNHLSPEGAIEFSKIIQSDIIRFGFINQE